MRLEQEGGIMWKEKEMDRRKKERMEGEQKERKKRESVWKEIEKDGDKLEGRYRRNYNHLTASFPGQPG